MKTYRKIPIAEAKKYGIIDHVIANRDDLDHLEELETKDAQEKR
jgi:hypothetical protein